MRQQQRGAHLPGEDTAHRKGMAHASYVSGMTIKWDHIAKTVPPGSMTGIITPHTEILTPFLESFLGSVNLTKRGRY